MTTAIKTIADVGWPTSKGRRKAPDGNYKANVWLMNGKLKLVKAVLINEATDTLERKFRLESNSSLLRIAEEKWIVDEDEKRCKEGWVFRIAFESEINAFFDY